MARWCEVSCWQITIRITYWPLESSARGAEFHERNREAARAVSDGKDIESKLAVIEEWFAEFQNPKP